MKPLNLQPIRRVRGSALLLHHCVLLEQLSAGNGRSARRRLEAAIGHELATALVRTLARSQAPKSPLGFFF